MLRPGSVRATRAAAARRQFLAVISNKPAAGTSANLTPRLERPMCVRAECPVRIYTCRGERIFPVAARFPPANSIQRTNDRACLLR